MKILRPGRLPTDVNLKPHCAHCPAGSCQIEVVQRIVRRQGYGSPLTFKVTVQAFPAPLSTQYCCRAVACVEVEPGSLREHEGLAREEIRPAASRPYIIGATSDTHRDRGAPCVSVTVTLLTITASLRTGAATMRLPRTITRSISGPRFSFSLRFSLVNQSGRRLVSVPVHQTYGAQGATPMPLLKYQ
jgi:hypothetical protein